MKVKTHTICYRHSDVIIMKRKMENPFYCCSYNDPSTGWRTFSFDCETCSLNLKIRGRRSSNELPVLNLY